MPNQHALLVLEHFLPYRLSVLSNRISQAIADTYAARFGIGITEWRVIAVLGRNPGLSANTPGAVGTQNRSSRQTTPGLSAEA